MRTVSVKVAHFRKDPSAYYVGIDGVFNESTDAVHAATLLLKKLIQIKAYCHKHGKPVIVLINSSRVPKFIHTALAPLRLRCISVVEKDADARCGEYHTVEDPMLFIARNSDVVIMLLPEKRSDDDQELQPDFGDIDVATVNMIYSLLDPKATIQTDPNEVVRNAPQAKPGKNDPYAAFYHEPLFKRVPYTYWQDIMDTMPDTKSMGMGIPTNVW